VQVILQGMVHMVPSPYTYPFLHCAARMSVMNTGLLAASPQYMPRYVVRLYALRATCTETTDQQMRAMSDSRLPREGEGGGVQPRL
jgi:hypothetical protein